MNGFAPDTPLTDKIVETAAALVDVLDRATALPVDRLVSDGSTLVTEKQRLSTLLSSFVSEAARTGLFENTATLDTIQAAIDSTVESAKKNEARMQGILAGGRAIQEAISHAIADLKGDGTYTKSGSRRPHNSGRKIVQT